MTSRATESIRNRATAIVLALAIGIASGCGFGAAERGRVAPHFEPGFNLFSPEQDVEIGRESAAKVTQQMPLLDDAAVQSYVSELGGRLAAQAPGDRYPYEFHVLNVPEINAFALPGGFVFVNRGTLEAAKDEGELAGVIAHEISHVALRHGTNQASKAYIAQAGLGILERILAGPNGRVGNVGAVIGAIGGLGLNAVFLKFGRTAETEADLTGAAVMAKAGYDPIDMANFFKTLEEKGGQGVPEFLSDHPDPGNRVRSIEQIRPSLHVSPNPIGDTPAFRQMKERLAKLPAAPQHAVRAVGPPGGGPARPEPPSDRTETFRVPTGTYQIAHPVNWDVLSDNGDTAAFAPHGGYGKLDDTLVFTHGVMTGVVDGAGRDLDTATNAFVSAQLQANQDFQVARRPQPATIGGRSGYATVLAGPSPVTDGLELDVVYTTLLPDGRLFYAITVSPQAEADGYQAAFQGAIGSIRFG